MSATPQQQQQQRPTAQDQPQRQEKHWAQLGESTFVFGIWFLYGVNRWLGRGPFRLFLYPVLLYYWLVRGSARRASIEYLQRLQATFQVFPQAPNWRHSLLHFRLFAETLLDKILALGGHFARGSLQFSGHERLLAVQRSGQGAVIMTAHMGCLELLQTAASWRQGFRLTVLVHTGHTERFNRILEKLNPEAKVRLLQVENFSPATAMLLAARIASGEHIAIAGDRVPLNSDRVATVDFLGKAAAFPAGPYLIASVLQCPVFLLACVHAESGYRVRIEHLTDRVELPRADRQSAMLGYANAYARWLEGCLRESPYDWFNFYSFWDQSTYARN